MSKHTPFTPFRSLFVSAALSLGLAGCDDPTDAERRRDAAEDADSPAGLGLSSGALARIGAQFHMLDAASLDLSGPAMSEDEARERVTGVDALGLDLSKVDPTELANYKQLSKAAMALGVPLIVEHVDAEALAELIGAGVEAEVAVVTSLGPNRYRVRFYGGGDADEALFESADGEVAAAQWSADPITFAVDEIGEALRHGASPDLQAAPSPSHAPTSDYVYFDFDAAEESFSPTTGQTSSLSMDFEAELALDSDRGKKVLFMRPIGSGQHPGTLATDGTSSRGYYQESQEVSLSPNNASVTLYAHAPSTANNNSTYTSSTGWTIGSSGGYPTIGYSSGDETSTTLSDFSMVNNTSGSTASWTFAMTTSWSNMFYHPTFEKCKVKSLPNLAKSNLNPEYEVYYRSDDSFTGSVTFTFAKETVLRKLWRGGDIITCKKNTDWWTIPRSRNVSINFGAV